MINAYPYNITLNHSYSILYFLSPSIFQSPFPSVLGVDVPPVLQPVVEPQRGCGEVGVYHDAGRSRGVRAIPLHLQRGPFWCRVAVRTKTNC